MDPGKRDPQGYYVVLAPSILAELIRGCYGDKVLVEEYDRDNIIIRVRSRRIAAQIMKLVMRSINTSRQGYTSGTPL